MTISRGVALSFGLALVIGAGSPWIMLAAPKLPAPAAQLRNKLVGTWELLGGPAEKDNLLGTPTFEFKPDGAFKITMGPIEMSGTYKVVKESGKVVTVEAEVIEAKMGDLKVDPKGKAKDDSKKTLTVTFEDDDTIAIAAKDESAPDKLKRKK